MAIISTYFPISSAPKLQFSPTLTAPACEMESRNASRVCPESVRPCGVSVAEIIRGISLPDSAMARRAPRMEALALRVSKMVSSNSRSTPPSINAAHCSRNASAIMSKLTSEEVPAILSATFEGPTDPATSTLPSTASAAARAMRAEARFISPTIPESPYSAMDMLLALKELVSIISAPTSM